MVIGLTQKKQEVFCQNPLQDKYIDMIYRTGDLVRLVELLYADDLVLTAESEEEVIHMFNRWKEEMEQRELKLNMEKTKLMVTRNKARDKIHSGEILSK